MNYNEDWGNRGANLIPSARPSIHNHESCIFATSSARLSMVRYGVDDGVDEVDNAMSKPSQPISPLMFEKSENSSSVQNSSRRNSLSNDNKNYTEDDTNLLLKSAPATLPSQLRYSDDSDGEQTSTFNRNLNDSFHSTNRSPVVARNRSASNVSLSSDSIKEFTQAKSSQNIKLVLPLISLVVILCSVYMKLITNESNKEVYDEYMFYSDIVDLGHRYKVDENNVLKVQTGISTIFKREDVGSFMFVYNSDKEYFNETSFNKFMNEVSFTASKYLRNDSIPLNYIIIEGNDLNMEELSEVMCKFHDDLHKSGVMLVKDIEAVPSSLAMAFHYFCDEDHPFVKKSAIFFTIDLAKCLSKETKSKYVAIENCLANKWRSIPPDSIGPLLARIVSVIIDVTSVF